jgi:pyrroline-5-carboxylate reductase
LDTPDPRIAFLGGGNMAQALLRGLFARGTAADRISVGEPDAATRGRLAEFGVATSADNAQVVRGADVIVIAVKPQQLPQVLGALAPGLAHAPLLLTVAAGVRAAAIAALVPGAPVVRAMPNRAAFCGQSATGLWAPASVGQASRALAERIMSTVGHCAWVAQEEQMDLVTALSGSGPAYFFLLAEQLAAAATARGLDAATARELAMRTLAGAGALAAAAAAAGRSLAEERAAVTSRGGTTEAGLAALADGGFDRLIAAALEAAERRGAALAAAATPGATGNTR